MTEAEAQTAPAAPKPRPSGISAHLRMTRKLYNAIQQRASAEGMTFSAWLRQVAITELRRARKRAPL